MQERMQGKIKRSAVRAAFAVALMMGMPAEIQAAAQPNPVSCVITNGFGEIKKARPEMVGRCLDNEQTDPNTSLVIQHTSKGKFVYDGSFPEFTNGYETLIDIPSGIMERLNNERYAWEKNKPSGIKIINNLTDQAVKRDNVEKFLARTGLSDNSVINYGPKDSPFYALTFDDGLNSANRWKILNTLNALHRHATFFYNWVNIKNDPAFIRAALSSGDEFGNHSFDHAHRAFLSLSEILNGDILEMGKITTKPYARDPFGERSSASISLLNARGYFDVGWSVDCRDYNFGAGAVGVVLNCVAASLRSNPGANIGLNHSQSGATAAGLAQEIALIENITGKKVGSLSEQFGYSTVQQGLSNFALATGFSS